jgi:hypothetical protein
MQRPADARDIFPGSEGAASLVAWLDRAIVTVREGPADSARAALEGDAWRSLDLTGIPEPILAQFRASLGLAADALRPPGESTEAAVEALLGARARLIPGA